MNCEQQRSCRQNKHWFRHSTIAVLIVALSGCAHYGDLGYSASADPFELLDQASEQARRSNQHILIIAGGDWCRWCYVLHDFLNKNARVNQALQEAFVTVKVYYGEQQNNDDFFAQLPPPQGYPYFWILSADQQVLGVQDAFVLENGRSDYDEIKFMLFIKHWMRFAGDA